MRALHDLDRRWIFLLMALAVAVPILLDARFPEAASEQARAVFRAVEDLPAGSKVLLAFDFDPSSAGELEPMATAFVRHCCEKKHKLYFLSLWPVGPQISDETIASVIQQDFPDMIYGEDYVNLGFKSGGEGVIKVILSDLRGLYSSDQKGTNIDQIPMCKELKNIQEMDLVINVSAGYPGSKEWVQYGSVKYPGKVRVVAGCTGVQAPLMYPYIPRDLLGLLGAIKGAAEYEELVVDHYDRKQRNREPPDKYMQGIRRMGPQLVAHVLMIGLIVAGNVVFFFGRPREAR